MNSEMVYCNKIPKIAQMFNYKLWVIIVAKAPHCCGERESVIMRLENINVSIRLVVLCNNSLQTPSLL